MPCGMRSVQLKVKTSNCTHSGEITDHPPFNGGRKRSHSTHIAEATPSSHKKSQYRQSCRRLQRERRKKKQILLVPQREKPRYELQRRVTKGFCVRTTPILQETNTSWSCLHTCIHPVFANPPLVKLEAAPLTFIVSADCHSQRKGLLST